MITIARPTSRIHQEKPPQVVAMALQLLLDTDKVPLDNPT
jgi:hypothetical protein